jgi:uncharacterized protein
MSDPLELIWYVSNVCNRKCPECYYPHGDKIMPDKEVRWLARWFINLLEEGKVQNYLLDFLGGEPLLHFDKILLFNDLLMEGKPSYTTPHPILGAKIYTNGDFITDDKLIELKKRNIRIQLNPTYDTLEEVERKICWIQSICHGCSLAIVLDKLNMDRLLDLGQLAIKYHCHMRINRLYDGGTIPGYIEKYISQMSKLLDMILESDFIMWPSFIVESMSLFMDGPKNPNSCGRWLLVVDPDGTVRTCNADLDTRMGSIYTHLHMKDFKMKCRWSAKNLPECQGCEWITWCQGGCPYTRKITYGTYNKKSPFCSAFKILFPKLMELKKRYNELE